MPTPWKLLEGKTSDPGVTNIRNVASPHWCRWLGVDNAAWRGTSFSEYGSIRDPQTGKLPLHWFALDKTEPLFVLAGIWTRWTSVRRVKEGPVEADLFGFLTTEPNAVVAPIHPKAIPVILTKPNWVFTDEALRPAPYPLIVPVCKSSRRRLRPRGTVRQAIRSLLMP
jgi:putative SOS response-associated peptidase YedK